MEEKTNVYVVNGFPERRPVLEEELRKEPTVGKVVWTKPRTGRDWHDSFLQPCIYWRETLENRTPRLITDGEMCCSAGHLEALEAIAKSGKPGLILKDDAELLGSKFPTVGEFEEIGADLLYLAGMPMDGTAPQFPHYTPGPLWWSIAYMVSPFAANAIATRMLESENGDRPHDERLLNAYTGKFVGCDLPGPSCEEPYLKARAMHPSPVKPRGTWESSTDKPSYAFDLAVLVLATDKKKALDTYRSYEDHGHFVKFVGLDEPGWDTGKEGGRRKLEWLVDEINASADNAIVLASDGYDVACRAGPQRILEAYGHMLQPLVVSGEKPYWPERKLDDALRTIPPYRGEDMQTYPYPCSGLLMGPAPLLCKRLEEVLKEHPDEFDDQALIQYAVLKNPDDWRIDREAYLFRSMSESRPLSGRGVDRETGTTPLVVHWNGASEQPSPLGRVPEPVYEEGSSFMEVAQDILSFRLMSEEDAERVASFLSMQENWKPLPGDDVPGDELRLHMAGLDELADALMEAVDRRFRIRWTPPDTSIEPQDVFAIRYSPTRQAGIRLHNDLSTISASLKLRDARQGGVLRFPRQNFDDRYNTPGEVLVWPSRVTHPHQVVAATEGERISVTLWTRT